MALLFCDSFDHYATTHLATKYEAVGNAAGALSIAAVGRNSTNGVQISGGGSSTHYLQKTLAGNYATLIVGAAFKVDTYNTQNLMTLIGFADAGTAQTTIALKNDGRLYAFQGSADGTLLGSSTGLALSLGSYFHVEAKVTFHNTAGAVTLRINGNTVLTLTSVNTRMSANNFASVVVIAGGQKSNPGSLDIHDRSVDDLYICDTSGSLNNDLLGDMVVRCLPPTGAGASANFARGGTDSGANWSQCSESTPDDDTKYVVSSTPGDIDSYAMEDLPTTAGTIKAVAVTYRARKDDAGTRTLRAKVRQAGTYGNGTNFNPATTYAYRQDIFETNPATSSPFTPTEVNSSEAGVEVVA